PLPGPRRNHPHPPGPGPGATLRGAMPLAEQPGPGGRVADLAPRRR
ncbi:DeoR family transcriptional regulator, partial [Streptomyces sp. MCAF7]